MPKIGLYLMSGMAPREGRPGIFALYSLPESNAGYVLIDHFDRSNMGEKLTEAHAAVSIVTKSTASRIPFNLISLPGETYGP